MSKKVNEAVVKFYEQNALRLDEHEFDYFYSLKELARLCGVLEPVLIRKFGKRPSRTEIKREMCQRLYEKFGTIRQVADHLGLNYNTIGTYINTPCRNKLEEHTVKRALFLYYEAHKDQFTISKRLKIHQSTVSKIINGRSHKEWSDEYHQERLTRTQRTLEAMLLAEDKEV